MMPTVEVIQKRLAADLRTQGTRFTAIISTDSVDRDGEVLMPGGMVSTDFERLGTVLWNHNPDQPIAKLVPGSIRKTERTIEATAEFVPRPDDWEGEWFPDFVSAMVKAGAIRGVSVGFRPLELPRQATQKDIERYGDGVQRVYRRWELLEFSPVSVPANQDALIVAVSKGLITRQQVREVFDIDLPPDDEPKPEPKAKTVVTITIPADPGPDLGDMVKISVARAMGKLYL